MRLDNANSFHKCPTYATSLRRDPSFLCCAAYLFDISRSLIICTSSATSLTKITSTFSFPSARKEIELGLRNRDFTAS